MKTSFQNLFDQITRLQEKIGAHKPFDDSLNRAIQDRLRIEWTYNSNAIEGNTLTLGETAFFLQEGLTSEGRSLKEFLEAQNHAEAIEVLDNIVQKKQEITEHFIKSLHGLLLKGIDHIYVKGAGGSLIKKPINIGRYKIRPNHVLTVSGKIHHYAEPEQVQIEMEKLLTWYYSKKTQLLSAIERASIFHYRFVSIHPFDDGNGRMSRLLMNLILMQDGYPPCVIRNENRRKYLLELEKIDQTNNLNSFSFFIAEELLGTMTLVYDLITNKKQSTYFITTKLNMDGRKNLILGVLEKEELSIGQIHDHLPQFKRPTLKKDLQDLVRMKKIQKHGVGKGVTYSIFS